MVLQLTDSPLFTDAPPRTYSASTDVFNIDSKPPTRQRVPLEPFQHPANILCRYWILRHALITDFSSRDLITGNFIYGNGVDTVLADGLRSVEVH